MRPHDSGRECRGDEVPHILEDYARDVVDTLHRNLAGALFYRAELIEVPGLLCAVLITYDDVRDDSLEVRETVAWEDFLDRMAIVKADWTEFDREIVVGLGRKPAKLLCGWEGRTIYFIRGGNHPEQWTREAASRDVNGLLLSSWLSWGPIVAEEVRQLRRVVPVGREHFREYERIVRVAFRFLFRTELGEGRAQSRTEPETEAVEIRDLIIPNLADSGFWKDLKEKYSVTEVVVDAKNTDEVTRDDLRQLYCYLKPAIGLWGFIVCRQPQPRGLHAFNRTLHKNFSQERGVLILSDEDLRRMVEMATRGQMASDYMRDRLSEFARSV